MGGRYLRSGPGDRYPIFRVTLDSMAEWEISEKYEGIRTCRELSQSYPKIPRRWRAAWHSGLAWAAHSKQPLSVPSCVTPRDIPGSLCDFFSLVNHGSCRNY